MFIVDKSLKIPKGW